jgi:protocatechuate 3,4-dioxygenase beta subunit
MAVNGSPERKSSNTQQQAFTPPTIDQMQRLEIGERGKITDVIGVRIIVAVCATLLPGSGSAQSGVAGSSHLIRITGRVADPMNMPLPRATVSLTAVESETAKSVLTRDDGLFAFDSVSPGEYVLGFDAPGFLSRRVRLSKATRRCPCRS